MIHDVIYLLVVLIGKLAFFKKQLQGVYCILNLNLINRCLYSFRNFTERYAFFLLVH